MRTVAVVNQKGGTGKTTTAVNLSAALGESGERVLLVDLDPQASASRWLGAAGEGSGLPGVLRGQEELADLATATDAPGVDVVPSSMRLGTAARNAPPHAVNALRTAVSQLPERWEWVVLDCPPSLGMLAVAALLAAREALVPVDTSGLSLDVLGNLFETVEAVGAQTGDLTVTGIVACRVDERQRLTRNVLGGLREAYGDLVFDAVVRERVALREAATLRRTVLAHEPSGDAAEDYRAVAAELREREP